MDDSDDSGLIGEFGVLVVPPKDDYGAWLVTLGQWDAEHENYVAWTDGPLLDSRDNALAEASKVLEWLEHQRGADNILRAWQQMQAQIGAEDGLDRPYEPSHNPWNI